jgi:RNA polymerase-binding transcription factor DksA
LPFGTISPFGWCGGIPVNIAQVRAALARIDEGTFGRCVADAGLIEEKRLQAVPWTPYCRKHQQELEEQLRLRTPTL